jgi:serine/threonine-protein kinase
MSDPIPRWKIPVAEGCYMVGHRDPDSLLQCNTYLRTFTDNGKPFHWCVDPGSCLDYPQVRSNLRDHVGELREIDFFSINHQDPDVSGNLPSLCAESPQVSGLVTEDTWRLVRHLGAQPRRLYFADKASRHRVRLPNGGQIRVVPTPFCHFRGAMAFYDPESRVLFSGDLFGGLNRPGRVQLIGEEADWHGIAQFHQIYMPTNSALRFAIEQIRQLKPAVKVIAPQHGFILVGDFMHTVMDRLERLRVGIDLRRAELDEKYLKHYRSVFQEALHEADLMLGHEHALECFRKLPADHELRRAVQIRGDEVRLMRNGFRALGLLVGILGHDQFPSFHNRLRNIILNGCSFRDVPLPNLGPGSEEHGESV